MKRIASTLAVGLCLSGCASMAPDTLRLETEHISHPLAGWPVSPNDTEDGLSTVGATLRWQRGKAFMEHGIAYNLQGENGGGFYGPSLIYTGRAGIEIQLKR